MNNRRPESPAGPNVSIIVVTYNERENISSCLESLLVQSYRDGEYEILVVDGDSTDGTIPMIKDYAARARRIRYIREPERGTAAARNTGVRRARFELVAFTDADCVATPEWLENLVGAWGEAAADGRIAAVGGPARILEGAGRFARAVKIGLNTYLASGGRVSGKQLPEKKYVADLPTLNVIYPRSLFQRIGFFDPGLKSEGEDAEFSYRILQSGSKLLYDPRPRVFHKYRPSPRGWWRNMLRYGRARGNIIVRYPQSLTPLYAGPALLVILLLLTPLGIVEPLFLLPLIYLPLILIQSLYSSLRAGQPDLVLQVFLAILITHLGYGIGLITRILARLVFPGSAGRRVAHRHSIGR